jgi:hypothetical protein
LVLNLYAYRATNPDHLWDQHDPVGPLNDHYLTTGLAGAVDVVCAWGKPAGRERVAHVTALLRSAGARLLCLGTNKNGSPRHPLYVHGTQTLLDWSAA